MKYILLAILLGACLFSVCQADETNFQQKRFLGSVWNWINDNVIQNINNHVINPVVDGINVGIETVVGGVNNVVNVVVDGVNTAVNVIADPFVQFGNEFLSVIGAVNNFFAVTLTDAVSNAVNSVAEHTLMVINIASLIFNPGQNNQGQEQDPCATTCFTRVLVDNVPTDLYFDQPNGCLAKGIRDPEVETYFADCCNQHSACLNSKCCTDNCQELKNQCDEQYLDCYRDACYPYYKDKVKFYTCSAYGSTLVSMSRNRTCSTTTKVNRKVCFCEY